MKTENAGARKGLLIAIGALAILGAAVGYRLLSESDLATAGEGVANQSTAPTLEELRERAQASSDDPLPWQELAFAYFERNMFAEAAEAYARATEIAPDAAVLWSSLGEARVMASDSDPMPPAAATAFRKALAIDPGDPRARYFLAVEKDLSGDHEGAIRDWLALLADTPPGAPWENDLVRTVQQVAAIHEIDVDDRITTAAQTRNILPATASEPAPAMAAIPGPSAEEMAAAAALTPSQQQNMADSMVASLAAKLESDPGNVDGWVMLMRSYATLGREQQARTAYQQAVAANPSARETLDKARSTLGF